MDFHPVATDTADNVLGAVDYILGLDISPSDKKTRLEAVFNLVGSDFYTQMFNDNSMVFDSTAIGTTGFNEMSDMVGSLATKVVRQYALGRKYDAIVREFYDTTLGKAQHEAFQNALSLEKHPTLSRSLVGETCKWCRDLVGTHVYPDGKYFARHDNCDCLIVVSGYNKRNGILNNYSKTSKNREEMLARDSELVVRDATDEVLATATPRVGSINYTANWPQNQKVGQEEQKFASWLLNTLGSNITYVPRSTEPTPDYDWDGVNAELKTLTTKSLDALSHKIREASDQTGEDGVAFLDLTGATDLWRNEEALFERIEHDLARFSLSGVLVKKGEELIRYYAKSHP